MDALQWMGAVRMRVQRADKHHNNPQATTVFACKHLVDSCIFSPWIRKTSFFLKKATSKTFSKSVLMKKQIHLHFQVNYSLKGIGFFFTQKLVIIDFHVCLFPCRTKRSSQNVWTVTAAVKKARFNNVGLFISESNIRPSMVTHTRIECSVINPSKVHTHSSEHTQREHTHTHQWAVNPATLGSSQGSVSCSVVVLRMKRALYIHSPPPTIPAWPETRTRNFWVTSPTL